jgi:hypothetical protein
MASGVYNRAKYNLFSGRFDVQGSGSHVINVALVTSSYTFNADHNYWTTISGNEASGTNYTAGGTALTNKTVTQDNSNDRAAFDADDTTWASSSVTARGAALYDNTLTTKDLVAFYDFSTDQTSSSGNFTIQWHANGLILLT